MTKNPESTQSAMLKRRENAVAAGVMSAHPVVIAAMPGSEAGQPILRLRPLVSIDERSFMNHVIKRVIAACLLLSASMLHAQTWPDKPVRMIVAYPPGGGVDVVARIVAQRLSETLMQQVLVDNRSGANGAVGADLVAKAAPDGYTVLMASTAELVSGPAAGQKIPYDPVSDFIPIALVGETPIAIVSHPSLPVTDLMGLVRYTKANPDRVMYATPGGGSEGHFAAEALKAQTGASMGHIPYRGGAPALNDIAGNQVPIGFIGLPPVVGFAKPGRVRILAVGTPERSPIFPDAPSVSEFPGIKDYRFTIWMGVFAPARTPAAIVQRLSAELVKEPATRERLAAAGVTSMGLVGAEFNAFVEAERVRYRNVARTSGIKIEN
jgi:tripartite-type tricarboxylate transporter receptor subunit TctC